MYDGSEIKVVEEHKDINLAGLERIESKLESFNEMLDTYILSINDRIVTIKITYHDLGGSQEFSYNVDEGPNENGYTINLPLRSRYSVSVTDSGDPDGNWQIDDYRLDPAPAHWNLGEGKGYGPVGHGNSAPHRFDFVKADTQFSINVILL